MSQMTEKGRRIREWCLPHAWSQQRSKEMKMSKKKGQGGVSLHTKLQGKERGWFLEDRNLRELRSLDSLISISHN